MGFIKYYTSFEKPESIILLTVKSSGSPNTENQWVFIEAIQEAYRHEGIKIGMEKGMEMTHFTIIQNMLARGVCQIHYSGYSGC